MRARQQPAPGGFTLHECCIVLAIIAIGLVMALPSFQSFARSNQVRSSLHMLSSDIAYARNTAITHRVHVAVCPKTRDNRCGGTRQWNDGWLVFLDPDNDRQPGVKGDILRNVDGLDAPDLSLSSSSGRPVMRYRPDGRSPGSNQTIRLCLEGQLAGSIVINNTGRVRTTRPVKTSPCGDT